MIRLKGFERAVLSSTASSLGLSSYLARAWLSAPTCRTHVTKNHLLVCPGSNGNGGLRRPAEAHFALGVLDNQRHFFSSTPGGAQRTGLGDGSFGSTAPHHRKLPMSLRACSRSFTSGNNRRLSDSFFARNHLGFVSVPHQMAYVVERWETYLFVRALRRRERQQISSRLCAFDQARSVKPCPLLILAVFDEQYS